MTSSQPTPDETLRIEALRQYAVLDTLPEQALDDLTALAAKICGAPMAAISLVDKDRQWFKARVGMEMAETPRDVSFCGHAVHQRDLFIVPDATLDERFGDNPLVIGNPGIRFYAGAPLVTPSDAALGALCVMDQVPRILTQWQEDALRILGRQVMTHLELHRHTHKLIESEKRLQIVTENARVGLVIVNEDRRYVYANKAYTDILDLSSSLIVGQRVSEVLAGVYEEQVRPRLDRAFAGERVAYDLRKSGAGGERYYEVRYEPSTVEGVVAMVVVVITDVTERKQGELALLHVAAIVESSDDAIIGKDLNSIITSWNKGAEKVFGYTSAEMVGTSIMRLIPVDRQDEEDLILTKIKSGESVKHFETLRQAKDGRLIDVSVTASPIKDATGKPIGVSKVARDITEREQAETELRESQATMASALASMTDAVFISDSAGQFINFNDAFASFHRFKDKSECARKLSDYQNILDVFMPNGELAPPDMWAVSRALRGETVTNAEYILRRKDTGETWIGSYSFSPIRNKDSLIIGSVTIGRDITERKRGRGTNCGTGRFTRQGAGRHLGSRPRRKDFILEQGGREDVRLGSRGSCGRDIGGLLYTAPVHIALQS
jgi:two-component system, cell cycle sensor histidine kinase and response regulator CckA